MAGIIISVSLLIVSTISTRAFALLGPLQPWMQATNGTYYPSDVGGPNPLAAATDGTCRW